MINIKCDRCGKSIKPKNFLFPSFACATPDNKDQSSRAFDTLAIMAEDDNGVYRPIDLCDSCKCMIYDSIFNCDEGDIANE